MIVLLLVLMMIVPTSTHAQESTCSPEGLPSEVYLGSTAYLAEWNVVEVETDSDPICAAYTQTEVEDIPSEAFAVMNDDGEWVVTSFYQSMNGWLEFIGAIQPTGNIDDTVVIFVFETESGAGYYYLENADSEATASANIRLTNISIEENTVSGTTRDGQGSSIVVVPATGGGWDWAEAENVSGLVDGFDFETCEGELPELPENTMYLGGNAVTVSWTWANCEVIFTQPYVNDSLETVGGFYQGFALWDRTEWVMSPGLYSSGRGELEFVGTITDTFNADRETVTVFVFSDGQDDTYVYILDSTGYFAGFGLTVNSPLIVGTTIDTMLTTNGRTCELIRTQTGNTRGWGFDCEDA